MQDKETTDQKEGGFLLTGGVLEGESSALALHGCVEVVLNGIIRSARHQLGHFGPLGPKLGEQLENQLILLGREGRLVN